MHIDHSQGMKSDDRRLIRHLAMAVVLKLLLLCALWWVFVRDAHVTIDAEQTAEHMGVGMTPQGASQ